MMQLASVHLSSTYSKKFIEDTARGIARLLLMSGLSWKLKTKKKQLLPTDNISRGVARIFLKGVRISSGMFLREGLGASL